MLSILQKFSFVLGMTVAAAGLSSCLSGDGSPSNEPPPANRQPGLSGEPPANAMLGKIYSFTPSASDPDGDSLTFGVTNLPTWASFDPDTGNLRGVPSTQHVGMHAGIVIDVSDGQETVSLAAFDINVVATASGSLSLSWTPPTTSADGSVLDDLDGYRVRWGTQSGDLPNIVDVGNASVSRVVVDELAAGNYFFSVSATDVAGNESLPSNEASGRVF